MGTIPEFLEDICEARVEVINDLQSESIIILFSEICQHPKVGLYSAFGHTFIVWRGEGRILSKKLRKVVKGMRKTRNSQKDRGKGAAEKSKRMRMSSQEFLEIYDKMWKQGPIVKYQNPDNWVEPELRPRK